MSFFVYKAKIKKEIKKNIKKVRKYHFINNLKGRMYLKNNSPIVIDIPYQKYINFNFLGFSNNLSNCDFSKITEFNESYNFGDIKKDLIEDKSGKKIYGHFDNKLVIFKNDKYSIGYISFKPENNFEIDFKKLQNLVSSAKVLKTNYIMVYIKNYKWKKYSYINKTLGRLGADFIAYSKKSHKADVFETKVYRSDQKTFILKSIEGFNTKKGYTSFIHICVNPNNKIEQYQYYSLLNSNTENINYDMVKSHILRYNRKFKKLCEKNKVLLFEDIFKELNIPYPKKFEGMEKIKINKVCSKLGEVKAGDVLFLLEPYRYKNDKETASDELRIIQAKKAYKKGALFIFSYLNLDSKIPHIVLENVRESHISFCSYLHSKNNVITICVTGSVGKTTTKDMLASVLNEKYKVLESPKNGNLQIQIGRNIQKIQPTTEVYIQEVGGGRPGGASRHSRMLHPKMTMITNIGTAHLGNFDSQVDLMNNKLGITEGMPKDGIFFKNLDDNLLKDAKVKNVRVVTYSTKDTNADYYASDIVFVDNQSEFYINKKSTGEKIHAFLNVGGIHNVLNAVVCFAMADYLEVPFEKIVNGLSNFKTKGIRQNMINVAGHRILCDCYNASLDSVRTALYTFNNLEVSNGGKKIVVLGDLTGIGDYEEEIHLKIADELSLYKFENIILHGDSIKTTSKRLKELNINHLYFKTDEQLKLNKYLKDNFKMEDVLLLKGSSKVELEYQIDLLFGTKYNAMRLLEEREFTIHPGIEEYKILKKCAVFSKYRGKSGNVTIKKSISRKDVVCIYVKSFYKNKNLKTVDLGDNTVNISKKAFFSCTNLKNVLFKSVKIIGISSFANCSSLESIKLNEGLLQISTKAFCNCNNLKEIYIPDSVVSIKQNSFENCPKLTILCHEGSYAEEYAKSLGINYKCV